MGKGKVEKAVSGLGVEEKKLIWEIGNFAVVRMHDKLIQAQKIEFQAGDSIGLSSKWQVSFHSYDDGNYQQQHGTHPPGSIGIFLRLIEKPITEQDWLIAECTFKIQKKDGTPFVDLKIGGKDWFAPITTGWGHPTFINKSAEIPLVKGSLVIHCNFRLYTNANSPPLEKFSVDDMLDKFHLSSKVKAGKDLALIKLPLSCNGGIEIFSRGGKQFQARKEVLAARSPVFEAMFRSGMKEEAEGKLELADISSKTVKVLLHYICTGELLPNWRQREVLPELTNAAAMYEFQDLLGFLDTVLGKVCDDGNVLPLLNLVDKLELKKAKKGLMEFVGRKGFNSKKKSRCCIV